MTLIALLILVFALTALLIDRKRHRRRAKEASSESRAILDSLGEGVVMVDAQLTLRYINAIGAKILGMPRKALINHPFPVSSSGAPSFFLERCRSLLETCQQTSSVLTDAICLKERRRCCFDLIATPKKSAGGAILVLQDKSSHYKVLEMGRDFAANASHELRTPITIIKGFAETLQDFPDLPRDMLLDIIEKIVRNCQRMDNLVKSLLTLADLDNLPESRFQECDCVSLAESCREVILAVYEEAEIEIQNDGEHMGIYADPEILELAILNLLDNAAKYSNAPARIHMRLEQREEGVQIQIRDRGIGIPPADLEHIFERFYTVDKARSRRFGGAGLGLSIVNTIIEKHQGTIAVESAVGEGTCFTVTLPLRREH